MKALFYKAVVYNVDLTCVSPIRTGAADGNTEKILLDSLGQAVIQGNSIAGAMREWLSKNKYKSAVEYLFGNNENEGHLIISNGVLNSSSKNIDLIETRPRVRIDRETGSNKKGGKFDVLSVPAGSVFNLTITLKGKDELDEYTTFVEKMLSAINSGFIKFGSNKTSGFGQFRAEVTKCIFDMTKESDRDNWINSKGQYDKVILGKCEDDNSISFRIKAHTDSILVKSGMTNNRASININENGRDIIPGSSIKGAFRDRAEYICSLYNKNGFADKAFGCEKKKGKNNQAGKIIFDEIVVQKNNKLEGRNITRTRINYFTGNVMTGSLITERPVCGDLDISIKILGGEEDVAGLLLLLVKDLAYGKFTLGGGYKIGRGYIDVKEVSIYRGDSEKSKFTFDDGHIKINFGDDEIDNMLKSFGGVCNENN